MWSLGCTQSLLKTMWENKKLPITSNLSFSHSVFYPCGELCTIFIKLKIVVCKVFDFGRVKFVVWERVNSVPDDELSAMFKMKAFADDKLNVNQNKHLSFTG